MKRPFLLITILLLLLSGCDPVSTPPPTEGAAAPPPVQTEPPSCCRPGEPLETDTAGALQVYQPEGSFFNGLLIKDSDLLLFSGEERTTLTLLTGDDLQEIASVTLDCVIRPEDPGVTATGTAVTYYDHLRQELVFLDRTLGSPYRVSMPTGILGAPALSADQSLLYYCTADALRVMDLESGMDRLLVQMEFPYQCINGLHGDDTFLSCSVSDAVGNWSYLFLGCETGQLLWECKDSLQLWAWGGQYFATRQDGAYTEMLTGSFESDEVFSLDSVPHSAAAYPLPEMGAVMLSAADLDGHRLDLYHLQSKQHIASVTLPSGLSPRNPVADPSRNCIWFLCFSPESGTSLLLRWNYDLSSCGEPVICAAPRRTAEQPDLAGLAECKARADAISRQYDMDILLWTDATAVEPWDYRLVPEYQVPLLEQQLQLLEQALNAFPEGFFRKAFGSDGNRIRVCLVRSILGKSDTSALESVDGLQFWDEDGIPYVCLTAQDSMPRHLVHELFHVMDSHVLSACAAYDNWSQWNPPDFAYDYDYLQNLQRDDWDLTRGENRHFIDLYSMSFPKEDRARIMEYAMTEGSEDCFRSDAMQAKLLALCLGLREGFALDDASGPFLWEQYLKQPIS